MTNQEFAAVVQRFRRGHGGQFGGLAFECLLLCSEEPRTVPQLEELTGCSRGRLNHAIRSLTPWFDKETGVVVLPKCHLLQRRRVVNGRGHRIYITAKGQEMLSATAQMIPIVQT